MCLIVKSGCKIEIAKESIVCYKQIGRDYFLLFWHYFSTPFRHTHYRYNKILSGPMHLEMKKDNELDIIEEGFHAYYTKDHSIPDISDVRYAIIPPGAEYCLGLRGDIVANKMIIFSSEEEFNKYMKKNK